jgi:hypothetical protein
LVLELAPQCGDILETGVVASIADDVWRLETSPLYIESAFARLSISLLTPLSIAPFRPLAAANSCGAPNFSSFIFEKKAELPQHATSNPHRSTHIAQHFLCKNIATQHALPSQGAAASAEIEGAGKAKRTQRALRQWVKTNTERQRGGGKEKKGGEREELRAASAPVT